MLKARDFLRTDRRTGKVLLEVPQIEFEAGERVGIQGPSGSGKSLLLRALAWLDRLDRGELHYRGRPVRHEDVPGYRRRVVYLHQTPSLEGAKVEDVLKGPFRLRVHQPARYRRDRAVEILADLGRDEGFLEKGVRELSGGEKQIAALVRALLLEPEMLLLDEPTAALDSATSGRLEAIIGEWATEQPDRRTALWVSHDTDQTDRLATRVIRVEAGRVIE